MDFDNPNELIEELDNLIVRHENGSSIHVDDLRRLREKASMSRKASEEAPKPKTMDQARGLARAHLAATAASPTGIEAVKS